MRKIFAKLSILLILLTVTEFARFVEPPELFLQTNRNDLEIFSH